MSDSQHLSDDAENARATLAQIGQHEDDASPEVALRIARAKSELGDASGAGETLAKAIARHPGHLGLVTLYAQNKLGLGDAAGALALLVPLEAEANPSIAKMIARARSESGDVRGAAETLTKSILRHPDDLTLVEQCARYRLNSGDAAAAVVLLAPLEAGASPGLAKMIARARSESGDV